MNISREAATERRLNELAAKLNALRSRSLALSSKPLEEEQALTAMPLQNQARASPTNRGQGRSGDKAAKLEPLAPKQEPQAERGSLFTVAGSL